MLQQTYLQGARETTTRKRIRSSVFLYISRKEETINCNAKVHKHTAYMYRVICNELTVLFSAIYWHVAVSCFHGNYIGHESGSSHSYVPVYSTEQHSQFIAYHSIHICSVLRYFCIAVNSFFFPANI